MTVPKNKESNQYDLFDKLEMGDLISQEVLDALHEDNQELFEILQKSNWLRSAKQVTPNPFFARVSQIRVYYRLVKDRGSQIHPLDQIKFFLSKLSYFEPPSFSFKPVLTILLAMILSFSVFVGGVQAADDARPGEFLYPVDLAIEDMQLFFTLDDQARLALHLKFAEERLAEAKAEFLEGDPVNAALALAGFEELQQSLNTQMESDQIEISAEFQTAMMQSQQENAAALSELLESAPESSKSIILQAIKVTQIQQISIPGPSGSPSVQAPDSADGNLIESAAETQTTEGTLPLTTAEMLPTPRTSPQPNEIEVQFEAATVWVTSVNLHYGPGLDYPVIGWLFQDQTVKPDKCFNGFVYLSEFSGWAKGTCFNPNPCGPPGSCLSTQD